MRRVWRPAAAVTRGTLSGAVSGFLTRPCCLIPAVLSASGASSAALAGMFAEYRPVFLFASGVALLVALVMNFRREGGGLNKSLAVGATLTAFALSAGFTGGL